MATSKFASQSQWMEKSVSQEPVFWEVLQQPCQRKARSATNELSAAQELVVQAVGNQSYLECC